MLKKQLVGMIVTHAKEYRKGAQASLVRNKHTHNLLVKGENPETAAAAITQDGIDAVVTDFVNFLGMKQGIDLALYANDLKPDMDEDEDV